SHGTVSRADWAFVKSTTTSHPASTSDRRSPVIVIPWRVSPTAWRSMAVTNSRSGSSATAMHTARPIFPPAPTTPTLVFDMPVDRTRRTERLESKDPYAVRRLQTQHSEGSQLRH